MAFANADECRLSHLRRITDGDGGNTSNNTAQTKLRATCANSGSATNVKMWGSFYPGTRSLSHSLSYSGNDTNWVLPHDTATTNTTTLTWGTGGTFFASRVLTPNATFLSAKWQANRTSGNDSVSLGSGSGTQKAFTFTTGDPANTDFWVIKMVTAANSAWENFFCDDSGSNNDVASEAITIYDQDGGGF
tara:strand:- start:516 stop:1085 length:570 start_codon:yes stop_codon:yes gene_type:complete